MIDRATSSSKIAAFILISVNLVAMIMSALIGAVGIWMISSPLTLSQAIQKTGHSVLMVLFSEEVLTVKLGIALVGVSAFIFFLSFMGFYGAICRSTFLLFMYSALIILLLLLECALLYYFATNLVEKGLQEQDGQWTHGLRLAFKCCEYNYTTLNQYEMLPPWSCCGPGGHPHHCHHSQIYADDCHRSINAWLEKYQTATYAALAVIHVVLASCSLVRRRIVSSHSFT